MLLIKPHLNKYTDTTMLKSTEYFPCVFICVYNIKKVHFNEINTNFSTFK